MEAPSGEAELNLLLTQEVQKPLLSCFLAGGVAGFGVDVSLFPLDTIKTRLQSPQGFWKSGGFKGVYNGLGPTALGSAPCSALFFWTYESAKRHLGGADVVNHCTAAALGEIVACIVRVPIDNVKQKMQAGAFTTTRSTVAGIRVRDGWGGFYKGFSTTVMRDVPFSFIQFPLYEFLRDRWAAKQGQEVSPSQGALCGSVGGAVAAAVTTPLDVAKTRLMLGVDSQGVRYTTMTSTLRRVYTEAGVSGLLLGIVPRVSMISLGGLVFFGLYESAANHLRQFLP